MDKKRPSHSTWSFLVRVTGLASLRSQQGAPALAVQDRTKPGYHTPKQKYNLTNHAEGVYIINSARNCIASKRNALYIIIAKAKYSLWLMIYTFGDEIHAKA